MIEIISEHQSHSSVLDEIHVFLTCTYAHVEDATTIVSVLSCLTTQRTRLYLSAALSDNVNRAEHVSTLLHMNVVRM